MNTAPYCVYRPELDSFPNIRLPVYPRSSGYVFRYGQEYEKVPAGTKNFVQLFWGVEGEAEFEIDGAVHILKPGHVVYRLPMQEHLIQTRGKLWKYYWVTFDGKNAENFMLAYDYPHDCFYAGECPYLNFRNFRNLMLQRTPFAWRQMFAEIVTILAKAGGCQNNDTFEDRITNRIIELCNNRFSDPSLNVNRIAFELDISRTTLLNIFKNIMKETISEYLTKVRLQHALVLLKDPLAHLTEISRKCGFNDVNYFCRFIKKNTGKRPTELR